MPHDHPEESRTVLEVIEDIDTVVRFVLNLVLLVAFIGVMMYTVFHGPSPTC